jgi:hypothetical protein
VTITRVNTEMIRGRESSVGVVTRLRARGPEFDSQQEHEIFSSPTPPDWLWDLPSLLSNKY